jgi:hypothetical protein
VSGPENHSERTDLDEEAVEEWFLGDPVVREEAVGRRWAIWVVAAVTAVALGVIPLINLFDRSQPQIADNGLEVCGFDYCVVQDGMAEAGMDRAMSRLSTVFLNDEDATVLAGQLVAMLGEAPVSVVMVDRLGGQIAGQYDPSTRTILIERQATAWIVAHEVAHVAHGGHGEPFQETLVQLVAALTGEPDGDS